MLKTWYTYLVPGALISGIVFFTLVSSLELNPVTIPYESSRLIFTVVPQGWGFFSRDPREPQTLIYQKVSGSYTLFNKSNSEPEYLFGLSRISRRQNIEFGQIMGQIPDSVWVRCPSNVMSQCEPPAATHVKSPYMRSYCKGEFVLLMNAPVPWAWSSSYNEIRMPFKVCKIYVD